MGKPTVRRRPVHQRFRRRRGAMAVLLAVLLVAFIGTAAFSVDVAYMHLVESEMRAAADAAAQAAVEQLVLTGSDAAAREAAVQVAAQNFVARLGLPLAAEDVELGVATVGADGKLTFAAGVTPHTAARVTARRTQSSAGGAIALFFGRALGVNQFEPVVTASAMRVDREIALVVDTSGSLVGQPWQDVTSALDEFFAGLDATFPDERVGLATYATRAYVRHGLTSDYAALRTILQNTETTGATDMADGIDCGRLLLTDGSARATAEKIMILISDGIPSGANDPLDAARAAAAAGIVIHTIAFTTNADEATLRDIANATGGVCQRADDPADLQAAYGRIVGWMRTVLIQ